MACNNPFKGFPIGLTKNGKVNYKICSYEVNHLEIDEKGRIAKCNTRGISPNTKKAIYEFVDIPCGKCLACKLSKARMWQDRILLEMKEYSENCFLTLTYDDEHLPKSYNQEINDTTGEVEYIQNGEFNTLVKKDLQLFLKRLRKNSGKKIRYFACGEYGQHPKNPNDKPRPHYHLILFGYKPDDLDPISKNELGDVYYSSEFIRKCWDKGFNLVGEATSESAGYVARYTTKKLVEYDSDVYTNLGIEKEFITMSTHPGIARNYFDKNKDKIYSNEHTFISTNKGARQISIPRYFNKILEQEDNELFKKNKLKNKESAINHQKITQSQTDKDYADFLLDKEYTLEQRTKILKEERSKI